MRGARIVVGVAMSAALWPGSAGAHASLAAEIDAAARLGTASPAAALTGATFVDPSGDNERGLAPDLTTASVGNDPTGRITLRLDAPNVPALRRGDFVALFLDTDARADTGNPEASGAEYAVAFDGATGTIELGRWNGRAWDFSTFAPSFRAVWSSGATIAVHRSELGATRSFAFWAAAVTTGETGRAVDIAPDAGSWLYALDLPPGAPDDVARPAPDRRAPRVTALRSSGVRGELVWLRYRASDDRGETRERVTIHRGARLVGTVRTAYAPVRAGVVYAVAWRSPRSSRGALRFCVRARDRAGHTTRRSCAALALDKR